MPSIGLIDAMLFEPPLGFCHITSGGFRFYKQETESTTLDYIMEELTVKQCAKCGGLKSTGCFFNQTSAVDGKSVWCKDCKRDYARHWSALKRQIVLKEKNRSLADRIAQAVLLVLTGSN